MSENNKEIQTFKSFDVIIILILLGLGAFFYSYPFNKHPDQEKAKNSRDKAEILGYQLAQIYRDQLLENLRGSKRGPASEKGDFKREGYIGSDSSGKPFKYKIQEIDANKLKVILTNKPDAEGTGNESDAVHVELIVPLSEST